MSDGVDGGRGARRSAPLAGESLKALTLPPVRLTALWGLAGAGLVTAASVAAARSTPGSAVGVGPVELGLGSVRFSQMATILVGTFLGTSEYEGGQIATSLAAVPGRFALYRAKTVTCLLVSMALSAGLVAVSLATALLATSADRTSGVPGSALLRPSLAAVCYLVLVGQLGLTLGLQTRNTVGAVASALGLVVVSLALMRFVPAARLLPTNAGATMYSVASDSSASAWAALTVAAWIGMAWMVTGWKFVTGDL